MTVNTRKNNMSFLFYIVIIETPFWIYNMLITLFDFFSKRLGGKPLQIKVSLTNCKFFHKIEDEKAQ